MGDVGPPVIRPARPGDVARLVELLEGGALAPGREDAGDLWAYRRALAEIDAASPGAVLVAEVGGAVVGMCQLIVFRHLQARGGRCAEIESMHVDAAHRSQGVGAALLAAAADRARALGCYRIQLTSNKARLAAHRFYEREGFVATHQGFKRLLE